MRTFHPTDPRDHVPITGIDKWTIRRAVSGSRTSALVIAAAVAVGLAGAALHPAVPITSAVTVLAMIPAVLVDVLVRRLPNRLVGGAALVGVAAAAASIAAGNSVSLVDGAIGALAMCAPLLVTHLIAPASMGFGDVKAAVVLGAALGLIDPLLPIVALALGSLGAAVHGLATRSKTIAFGPGLLGGAALVIAIAASSATFSDDVDGHGRPHHAMPGAIS